MKLDQTPLVRSNTIYTKITPVVNLIENTIIIFIINHNNCFEVKPKQVGFLVLVFEDTKSKKKL